MNKKEIKIAMITVFLLLSMASINAASATNTYNITDTTYNNYFNTEGYITDTSIQSGDVLDCSGNITNKNMNIDRPLNITSTDLTGQIINGTITILPSGSGTNITNLTINNANQNGIIIDGSNNNTITNNNITAHQNTASYGIHLIEASDNQITGNTINTIGDVITTTTYGIYLEGSSDNILSSNTIHTTGAGADVDWSDWRNGGVYPTIGVNLDSGASTNNFTNNQITTDYNNVTTDGWDTILGFHIHRDCNGNTLTGNTITTTGYSYGYGLEIVGSNGSPANNNTVTNNTINTTGVNPTSDKTYANGVKVSSYTNNTLISGNQINVTAPIYGYGVYLENFGGLGSVTVDGNNVTATGAVNYVFELWDADNLTITNNHITGTGNYSMGIGTYSSANNTITGNTITTIGDNNAPHPSSNADAIPESNEGIKLHYNSDSNTIEHNTINSSDTYAINSAYHTSDTDSGRSNNNTIRYNYLNSDNGNKQGNNAVTSAGDDTVTDNYNLPLTNFTATPTTGNVPLTVQFTDTSTNNPTTWNWDFDNNGTTDSTQQNPTYTYNTPGTYTVKLTTTGTGGSDDEVKTDYIIVNTPIVVADFTATPTTGNVPLTVQFTDTSTNNPTTWNWDFDNNGTTDSTQQNPTHTYNTPGTYTVTLTASNPYGTDTETKTTYINANAKLNIYSTALENTNPGAPDPGIPGFTGPAGNGKVDGNTVNPAFKEWASQVVNYTPANQEIGEQWKDLTKVLGPVTGDNFDIVSLGDLNETQIQNGEQPGSITLSFNQPIVNGNGADFAVFENGFMSGNGIFAELAYVEVSTDGNTYIRFPSISLTPSLVGGYGSIDPTNVYNLVGKHVNAYGNSWGTPFDLNDLANMTEVLNGTVNLNNIKYIRIVDIPGNGYFKDSQGNPIYDAWLTYGSGGLDLEAVGAINIATGQAPVADFTADKTVNPAPLIVQFTDLSTNNPTTWNWDFDNNGTTDSTQQNPTHTYTTPGTYTIKLTATNLSGSDEEVKTDYITVREPVAPVANFTATPTTGNVPLNVQFTDTSTNYPTTWNWDFDNNGTTDSTQQNPTHTYNTPGTYTIKLTVTNLIGSDEEVKTNYITVNTPTNSPVADFTATPTNGYTPLTIQFTDTSSNNPSSWSWDFNNDNIVDSTQQNPTWTYNTPGTYTIKLTATNLVGSDEEEKTDYIKVATNGLADTPWPKFGGNPSNTGQSAYNGPHSNNIIWTYTTGGRISSSPAIGANGTIYIGNRDAKVYALNPDGTLKWTYTTGDSTDASPTIVADGTIYIGSNDNKIYALNPDGTLKWTYTTGSKIYGSPAIGTDGTIYIGSYDKNLYALNPNGTIKWNYTAGYQINGCPAIGADGTIYFGCRDSKVYALNPDGTLKWNYTAGDGGINGSPAIGTDGTIYIGSYDKKFYALNPDGTLKWNYTTGGAIIGSSAIGTDGTIYIGSNDNKIYALNPDGTLKWNYTTGGAISSSPSIGADGIIYIGSDDNKLYALNPDGTLKWNYTTGSVIRGSAIIKADGTIYIGSNDNKIYAFKDIPPIADFTADRTSGGVPITVHFTDQSQWPGSWAWDFNGDHIVDSTEQNPSYTYTEVGEYIVSLTVTNQAGNSTKTLPITLSMLPPVADFVADSTSGTFPFTVHFTDQSLYATAWAWDFNGDNIVDSTEQNPIYTYTTPGTYTVKLNVTGYLGNDEEVKTDYIAANYAVPVADFTGTPTLGLSPLQVQFTDQSTGNITSYAWDFNNDGTTDSTLQNPTWTYHTPRAYTVKLTVTGPGGSDDEIKTNYIGVNVLSIPTDKDSYIRNGNRGDTNFGTADSLYVRVNTNGTINRTLISFDLTSIPAGATIESATLYTYMYGGSGSTISAYRVTGDWTETGVTWNNQPSFNPVSTYVTDPGSDEDVWVGWNVKQDVLAYMQGTANYGWMLALSDESPTSTNQAANFRSREYSTITQPYLQIVYSFTTPIANFTATPLSGTEPLQVTFTNQSTDATSYAWDFDNNGTVDSNEKDPTWTYQTPGTYTVKLTATGLGSSDEETKTNYITVNPAVVAPFAQFTGTPTTGTVPITVTFTNTSTGTITSYAWDFTGDGTTDSTDQNPTWIYDHPGTYTVKLNITGPGGIDEETKTDYIIVNKSNQPDLLATEMKVTNNPYLNYSLVEVTVTNIGLKTTGWFNVTLYDNGTQVGEQYTPWLASDSTRTLYFIWSPDTIGEHNLQAIIDNKNNIQESNENNNTINQLVDNRPDLTPTELKTNILPFNYCYTTVKVTNNGENLTEFYDVSLYDNGTQIGQQKIYGLKKGETKTITFLFKLTKNTTHNLQATTDPQNTIPETNENNNTITKQL